MAKKSINSRGKAQVQASAGEGSPELEPKTAEQEDGGPAADGKGPARVGLRGAAPWAARHAKKHAAEAAARNAEPPKPGSARATLREPEAADQIKARITELHNATVKIRTLKKNLNANFFEIGLMLGQLRDRKLYEAKGYTSLEAFAERELELGKTLSVNLVRIPLVFVKESALQHGVEALIAALTALDEAAGKRVGPAVGRTPLPLKPPTR